MLQTWTPAKRPVAGLLASSGLISRLAVLVPVLEMHTRVPQRKIKENSLKLVPFPAPQCRGVARELATSPDASF